jgi:N-acetylglucosaminyl-diphospho-decaprenol L-rhamnosyltransferase
MILDSLGALDWRALEDVVAQLCVVLNTTSPAQPSFELQLRQLLAKTGIELSLIKNSHPQGFGANQNAAFALCKQTYFCILNPDVVFDAQSLAILLTNLQTSGVGCAYPMQYLPNGQALDFERSLITPWQLFRRYALRQFGPSGSVDWVSGSAMAFPSEVYRQIEGFDERYFMYCEDVDICLRLQNKGYALVKTQARMIHDTQRQSLRDGQHLTWHIRSLLRLWTSRAFWTYRLQAKYHL